MNAYEAQCNPYGALDIPNSPPLLGTDNLPSALFAQSLYTRFSSLCMYVGTFPTNVLSVQQLQGALKPLAGW